MPNIVLPNEQVRHFEEPVTGYEIARSISPSLAKAAIAVRVDGALMDLTRVITEDCKVTILSEKDPESLEIIRHSTAHLLAQAVKKLFPSAQVTIGPVIEDGFYYDFAFGRTFTPQDLADIEATMADLVKADLPVTRRELSREEAIRYFINLGETYKAKIIADIPEGEVLTLYRQGDFEDLCRGPHVPSTGKLNAFKLTKLAGAYWRGDAKNEMLQRIYGTAWHDKASLQAYLLRIEEAEKRDHRRLGKILDLFHFQEIAPGMVFWHAQGWTIYLQIEHYIREKLRQFDYQEIKTPQLVDKVLWEKSGHWDNFREQMFLTETESRLYAVKPMNCPCHVQVYNQGIKSYRDLPVRYAEFGSCHRSEPSGSLHGLMRVRGFTQDDAHIFCTTEQIQAEVAKLLELVRIIYSDFGFDKITYRLARRPALRVGTDEIWDIAEGALQQSMETQQISWIDAPGEGAFYGPKIECSLSDCLGRIWQCGTIQVDFSTPTRLGAHYVAEDGSKHVPVMLHRALLGSFERFIGILIEHYAGKFPLWLSPTQIVVLNISEKHSVYAQTIYQCLQDSQFRANIDLRNEKIGFKIREHTLLNVPYMLIVGDKETDAKQVTLRMRSGQDLGMMTLESVCDKMRQEIAMKAQILEDRPLVDQ